MLSDLQSLVLSRNIIVLSILYCYVDLFIWYFVTIPGLKQMLAIIAIILIIIDRFHYHLLLQILSCSVVGAEAWCLAQTCWTRKERILNQSAGCTQGIIGISKWRVIYFVCKIKVRLAWKAVPACFCFRYQMLEIYHVFLFRYQIVEDVRFLNFDSK